MPRWTVVTIVLVRARSVVCHQATLHVRLRAVDRRLAAITVSCSKLAWCINLSEPANILGVIPVRVHLAGNRANGPVNMERVAGPAVVYVILV